MTRYGFHNMPLAVIGMGCRLPGADSLEQYWQLIRDGRSAIVELPRDRFDPDLYFNPERGVLGKSYTKLGGLVPDRPFDRDACPVPEELIANADVSDLAMLEVATAACRHAGLDPFDLPLRNTAVFIGHSRGSPLAAQIMYSARIEEVVQHLQEIEPFGQWTPELREELARHIVTWVHETKPHRARDGKPDVSGSAVGALIAEAFGLTGPYMAVDAACASALFALAAAARALHHGRVDMAIVGGSSYSSWLSLVLFSQAQALSATGSFPFDARADGFISSDGHAAVVLKTLERAIADGDHIHGLIRGIGISSDGRGRSLWAPRKEGQVEAFKRAYPPGVDPAQLQYVEAHSTSTQLGDATEVESLATALRDIVPPGTKIPIASVKANIGHTCETAGMAGLIKAVLAVEHGVIPPAINYEMPNTSIDWDSVPLFVPTTALEWPTPPAGQPRRAAVDAFGIGGLNTHVVVDQYRDEARSTFFVGSPPTADGALSAPPIDDDEAVAVVGMGAIFPGARTVAAYWDALLAGRHYRTEVPRDRWSPAIYHSDRPGELWRSPTTHGGFVADFDYDWKRHRIPPKQLETADLMRFMLLDAADQALCDAGYESKPYDHKHTGVVVGTIIPDDFFSALSVALHLPELERELARALRERGLDDEEAKELVADFRAAFLRRNPTLYDETGSFSSSTLASSIAKTLDLMGGAFVLDAGEASSLAALAAAVDMLRSGSCDLVFCAGAQRHMTIDAYEHLALRGMLSSAPGADGLVPAEGVGMLLLKRLQDARRDGDPIRAVVRGVAVGTAAGSPASAMQLAIERALAEAGALAGDVTLVETASPGLPDLEAQEARALAATYGATAREQPVQLDSVTGQTGHLLAASGMASLIKAALALQHGPMPPGGRPDGPTAGGNGPVPLPEPAVSGRSLIGVSVYAFRGQAYHALIASSQGVTAAGAMGLSGGVATAATVSPANWRIVRLGAVTLEELRARVVRSQADAASLYASADRVGFGQYDWARVAFVAESPDALARKLKLAAEQLTVPAARPALEEQAIFVGTPRLEPPRVAFLFPGQGSQYVGMLRELTGSVPAATAKWRELDDLMGRLGHPTFAELAWGAEGDPSQIVWHTQASLLLADTIVCAALTDLGIRPDVISGHSYGEYPALVAVGAWTMEQAIRVTHARCQLIEGDERTRGDMLATTAPPEVVRRLAVGIAGTLGVANHNAPDQTVVGGESGAIAEIGARLAAEGYETRPLDVPRPFHTPLMAGIQEPFRRVVEAETFYPAKMPLLSSVTNRYVADPLEIRENLVRQFTEPVRYVDLVERLVRDGVSVLVEVGPRQVLTRLHRRILAQAAASADASTGGLTIVASDNPKRPGVEQLARVRAALECAGVPVGGLPATDGRAPSVALAPAGAPAAAGPILHFDATLRRKQSRRDQAAEGRTGLPASEPLAPAPAARDELEAFLVGFVCEQTGYPVEVVQLDADLEADLGIDSLKKAQLFGELRERYSIPVESTGRLSLNDFPTLRHVLDFLRQTLAARGEGLPVRVAPAAEREPSPAPAQVPPTASVTGAPPPRPNGAVEPGGLALVRYAGTPYEMGRQQGRAQAEQIRALLRQTAELRRADAAERLLAAAAQASVYFTPDGVEEMRGLADALELPLEEVIVYNIGIVAHNLDLSGVAAPGCAQLAVTARSNGAEGLIHGANEDWPLALGLPERLPRVVQVRHPARGIPHLVFGIPGQVGWLNGVNARGVAISSATLLDRAQPAPTSTGCFHTALVKTILERADTLDAAIEIVRGAPRLGVWSLCISHHPSDRIAYLEYDGADLRVELDVDLIVGTNHCQLQLPVVDAPRHSHWRLRRLQSLLGRDGGSWTLDDAKAALRDRYDLERQRETAHPTMNTVQRVDNQISVVMRPGRGEVWVTPGPEAGERADHYYRLDLGDLLGPAAEPWPAPEEGSPDADGRVMSRFVLRMVDAPLPDSAGQMPSFAGPALVVGDNPTARALRTQLGQLGVRVLDLPSEDSHAAAVAALRRLWEEGPVPHLFLTTARDVEAACDLAEAAWLRRREDGLLRPYLLCQEWTRLVAQADLVDRATLVATTALGGDFGFAGGAAAVEGGALAGLLKSIRRESPGLRVKVVDAPPEEPPEQVVAAVFAELASGAPQVEVGYVRGRRRLVRAVPRPAMPRLGHDIPRGGTWVVTGGARGITAIVARELGRRYGLVLHLLGTSPLPRLDDAWRDRSPEALRATRLAVAQAARQEGRDPTAAWAEIEKALEIDRSLRAFAEQGVRATYHSCDVSNRAALAEILERIRAADGPIQGILHGAGVEVACRFDHKQLANVGATIAAKVDGAAALLELTRDDPLACFVAFGSVSGRFGGLGQTDYSLASDMLSKLVAWLRAERPTCSALTIDWPAWDEVGMSVRPETRLPLEMGGFRFMPPAEGVEHLVDELRAGAPEAETVILDQARMIDLDGIMPTPAERQAFASLRPAVMCAPLIDGLTALEPGRQLLAEVHLDPRADPFLVEHQFGGAPLLPSVIGIEAIAEAAALLGAGQVIAGVRDVEIPNGLRFFTGRPQRVRVRARRAAGGVECELSGDFFNRHGQLVDPDRVYLTGVVDLADRPAMLVEARPEIPSDGWHDFAYPDDARAQAEHLVRHGSRFQGLRQVCVDAVGGWGRIVARPPDELAGSRAGEWVVPAMALDSCLVACAVVARRSLGVNQLPRGFVRLVFGRRPRPGEVCTVRVVLRGAHADSTQSDFTLYGEDGAVILLAEGHRSTVVGRDLKA